MTDAELAALLAEQAGAALLALRSAGELTGSELGAAGDRIANTLILDGLARHRPEDAVLSEESRDDLARLQEQRVWIVDPLDGTREYADGWAEWAVHVALAVDGRAALGAVAVPARGQLFRSDRAFGLEAQPAVPRILISRTRPPAEAEVVREALGGELVPMGSAGAKTMAVVVGEAEIYLHSGGQFEWDSCAPVAVALAAGLHCSRLDGSALVYNRADPYLPDLLVCRPEWAERVLEVIGTAGQVGLSCDDSTPLSRL